MKRSIGYLFAELVIVTLGVSFSLLMNDLREQNQRQERERDVLKVIQANLQRDSINLWRHSTLLEYFEKNAAHLKGREEEAVIDSLNLYVDIITSYSMMNIVDIGFQELQSGNLQLSLSNDTLNREIMVYYTDLRGYIEEWNQIDREFILNSMIPYVIKNIPNLAVKEPPGFTMSKLPGAQVWKAAEFQNLVTTFVLYKKAVYMMSVEHKKVLARLRENVEKEIDHLKPD